MSEAKKEWNLFHLAWPIFIGNILGILLGFIDVYVLSLVNDLAASAISAAGQMMSVCTLVFGVVCGATSILVAQYLGKGNRERASQVTVLCITLNVIFGILISGIVLVFHRQFRLYCENTAGDVKAIFKLGVPSIFDSLNYSITQLVITGIIFHNLSETDIIARTYLQNIAVFFQLFTGAISSATQLMISHEIGAGDYEKADSDCRRGLRLSVLMTGVFSLGAVFFSGPLFGIFTENQEVIRIGFYLLLANVFVEIGRAVNLVYVGGLRGAGDVSIPVLIAVCCMWTIAVGGSCLSVNLTAWGIVGIWIIAGVDECVRGAIMHGRWRSGKWKQRRLTEE